MPRVGKRAGVGGHTSRQRHHTSTRPLARGGNRGNRFAVGGLGIQLAFRGDHQVGILYHPCEVQGLQHQSGAGDQCGRCESQEARAQSTRGTGSGNTGHRNSQIALDDPRIVRESRVQLLHHLGSRTLLRPVHGRSSLRTRERIRDIARHLDPCLSQAWVQAAGIDAGQSQQRRAAGWQLSLMLVQKTRSQCRGHSGPAIVGGASPNPNDESRTTGIESGSHELARAVG